MTTFISFDEGEAHIDWLGLTEAIEAAHSYPRAQISDQFLYRGKDTLMVRQAWIDGIGVAVKSMTVFPDNPANGLPSIHGSVALYEDATGIDEAMIDFHLVTKWKTAGDSLLAARKLARMDSRNILILGVGPVAQSLYEAYSALFPDAQFSLWNRTVASAEQLAAQHANMQAVTDLEKAVREADIVSTATMATAPLIKGEWLQPGQHIDLVGAYRTDMREADDVLLQRGRIFVDSYDTALDIGELKTPLESGAISRDDLVAEYYEMERFERISDTEITIFKNGGGAHLDLMTARFILDRRKAAR